MAKTAKAKRTSRKAKDETAPQSTANVGFEAKLWAAADKLRNNMDAAEYKHVVLGLIFLKYISDSFEEMHAKLVEGKGEFDGADPEDPDEYRAKNVFWVPKSARWSSLQAKARQPDIGKKIDDAMVELEKDNPRLKGVLPKDYARPGLDKQRLGELVDLIGTIGLGENVNRSRDILGRVYEYFLTEFASAEGKNGGQFYTPSCVVRTIVEMLAPYKGRIYDPACGSGGMFVQSEKFVESHGGKIGDISIYGQESNHTTRRLAMMNLAIRGIEADFGAENADTFKRDLHKDLKADFILANPPFNDSDWARDETDVRWKFGIPPEGNANFAWVQHFIHHLAPNGVAGFVLGNIALTSETGGEDQIREGIIKANLVDCIVTLPEKLFYSTPIPVGVWVLSRQRESLSQAASRRSREVLFIDASRLGEQVTRTHHTISDDDISRIANTYRSWGRGNGYVDVDGFCRSVSSTEIAANGYRLLPAAYVNAGHSKRVNCISLEDVLRSKESQDIVASIEKQREAYAMFLDTFAAATQEMSDIEKRLSVEKRCLGELLEKSSEGSSAESVGKNAAGMSLFPGAVVVARAVRSGWARQEVGCETARIF